MTAWRSPWQAWQIIGATRHDRTRTRSCGEQLAGQKGAGTKHPRTPVSPGRPSPAGLIFRRSVALLGGYRAARSNDPARGANVSRGAAGRASLLLAVWCFHRKHDLRWPSALMKSEPERFRDLCLGERCRGAGLFKSDGDRLLLRCWQKCFCVPNSGEPLAEQGKRILDGLKSCWVHDRLAIGRPHRPTTPRRPRIATETA
jgi:hypothetical protein